MIPYMIDSKQKNRKKWREDAPWCALSVCRVAHLSQMLTVLYWEPTPLHMWVWLLPPTAFSHCKAPKVSSSLFPIKSLWVRKLKDIFLLFISKSMFQQTKKQAIGQHLFMALFLLSLPSLLPNWTSLEPSEEGNSILWCFLSFSSVFYK